MQLKMSASPKSPNTSASSGTSRMSSKVDDDDDYNDDDYDDIEDPESLNRTLSEIIEGKRSSSSLIAILNRENSDCDTSSVKSSGSEASNCGHKLVKTNSFKGAKIEENVVDSTGAVENTEDDNNVPVSNCDSARSQGKLCAINQSDTSGEPGNQSQQTGSLVSKGDKLSNSAMHENQSRNDSVSLSNGDETFDANENLHSKGARNSISDSNASEQTSA